MKEYENEVIGDFSAKSYLWGSKIEERRGEMMAAWMAEEYLVIQNRGCTPTFARRNTESYIDITFSKKKIAKQVKN